MQTVYIVIGLIGSGKSTWSKSKLKDSTDPTVIVSKDALRYMINGGDYIYNELNEPMIDCMAKSIIRDAINHNKSVIVDETHVIKKYRTDLVEFIKDIDDSVRIVYVWCSETDKNLDYRMKDSRGYDRETWEFVYKQLVEKFESFDDEQCDDLIEFKIGDSNEN